MKFPCDLAVTGRGIVTCLGASGETTLAALKRGERVQGGHLPILAGTRFGEYLAVCGDAPDLGAYITDRRMRKFMSRQAELTAAAARQAMAQARPHERGIPAERIGLYAGVGLAAVDIEASHTLLKASLDSEGKFSVDAFCAGGLRTIHPLWSFHTLANMPACIVSVLENIRGPNGIYTPWEDQTALALIEAVHALERGDIDCAVVVAADWAAHPGNLVDIALFGFIRPDEVASYGAGCLVLERASDLPEEKSFPRLQSLALVPVAGPPDDPLAPLVGRTVAAAPLLLVALAGECGLGSSLTGGGGQRFSFEVRN